MAPRALVLSGYGINCEEETRHAFERAGGKAEIVHVNDLIDSHRRLRDYQILAIPGGFSYGDDTGSGNALANKIRNHLWEEILDFHDHHTLTIGICNGFQVLARLGLLPAVGGRYGEQQVALLHNDRARYFDRWVDLDFVGGTPWMPRPTRLSAPIAHGEGRFYAPQGTLSALNERGLVAARYVEGEVCRYQSLPANPNGSLEDIAALQDRSGRILGVMPHPERAMDFTQLPDWTLRREICRREGAPIPSEGPGLQVFRNAVNYFSGGRE